MRVINFVILTKLTDVAGRANYISNPQRQEEIILMSDSVDWIPYRDYERNDRKGMTENNEARELIIALPNDWYKFGKRELAINVQNIAEKSVGKKTDLQWSVHMNKNKNNLHVHIIFSERVLLSTKKKKKVYDRDIYLTNDGKVARSKSERAADEHGNILPPVHRKGDSKGTVCEFSVKDVKYKSKKWLQTTKTELREHFENLGFRYEDGIFRQYHEGKGNDSPKIKLKNKYIKLINKSLSKLLMKEIVSPESFAEIKKEYINIINSGKIPTYSQSRAQKGKSLNIHAITSEENKLIQEGKFAPEILKTIPFQPQPPLPAQEHSVSSDVPDTNITDFNSSIFDPAALIRARDEYAETYLTYACVHQNKVDTNVINAPNELKSLVTQLQDAERKVRLYTYNLAACNFFQVTKKKEIQAEIDKERQTCELIATDIERYGVTIYQDNHKLDRYNVTKERVDGITRLAERFELPKLEREAEREKAKQKTLDTLSHIEYSDVEAAYRRFKEKLDKLPSEHKQDAYRVLLTPYRANVNVHPITKRDLDNEIDKLIKKSGLKPLPQPKQSITDRIKLKSVENKAELLNETNKDTEIETSTHRNRGKSR
jgi:hypothetical protein